MSREENKWRDEQEDSATETDGIHSPPTDDELLRIWDELEPQTPSPAFSQRMAALIETLRHREEQPAEGDQDVSEEWGVLLETMVSETHADLGAVLTVMRERRSLSHAALRTRLHVDTNVLIGLERNAVYPETLTVTFWRGFAAAVECRTELIANLIACYDRTKIAVSGSPAARSGPSMTLPQRAAFLGEPEPDARAQLDRRREELVGALRQSP
jgi:hypothetical protein